MMSRPLPAVLLLLTLLLLLPPPVGPAGTGRLSSKPKLSSKPRQLVQEETETHNFTRWIEQAGGSIGAIRVGRLPRGNRAGRGVLATRAIAQGEVVARVPLSLLINIEHVLVDPVLGPLLDENGGAAGIVHAWLGDVDALAVFLCHERRKHGHDGRELSHWEPWISLLPPLDQNASVLTYAEDLLTELQASPVLTTVRDGRRRLTEVHGRLLKLKGFRGRPPRGAFRKYLREEHAWGLLMVMSRSHTVRVKDGEGAWHDTSCLVPLADMFNTGGPSQINVDCATNDDSTHFECKATKPITTGSELLVPYGGRVTRMRNSKLLTEYGFTIDPNADPETVAALSPEPGAVEIPTLGGKRWELLRSLQLAGAQGQGATATASVEIGVRPRAVLGYAAARVMTENQLEHGGVALLSWILDRGTLPDDATWQGPDMFGSEKPGAANSADVANREDLRSRILREVEMMLMGRLKQYRTTAGADELQLAEIASKLARAAERRERGGVDLLWEEAELTARRDTIRVRLGEKRTLMAVKEATLKEMRDDDQEESEYHAHAGAGASEGQGAHHHHHHRQEL